MKKLKHLIVVLLLTACLVGSASASAETKANDYADGLAKNYDSVDSANKALTDAKAYVDTALTWGTI